jgi:hypothetical protein
LAEEEAIAFSYHPPTMSHGDRGQGVHHTDGLDGTSNPSRHHLFSSPLTVVEERTDMRGGAKGYHLESDRGPSLPSTRGDRGAHGFAGRWVPSARGDEGAHGSIKGSVVRGHAALSSSSVHARPRKGTWRLAMAGNWMRRTDHQRSPSRRGWQPQYTRHLQQRLLP